MSVFKGALLLLLLVAASAKPDHAHDHAAHDHAAHDHDHAAHNHSSHDHTAHDHDHAAHDHAAHDHCQKLKKVAKEDIHQIFGDWVLVWSVSDHKDGQDLLKNVSSSHVEMRLVGANDTLMFNERNVYRDNKCINYYINISTEHLNNPEDTMQHLHGKMETDGVFSLYNDTVEVGVYETCPNCMMMVFKDSAGRYLLNYRKEGHHQDVDHMKADHEKHRKLAECLGFKHDEPYISDGVIYVCNKKSSPEEPHIA
ncbi:hypothetical protein PBY51_005620 [Eleginops maclovinus]|uniref:Uncharacterized protein n=1 Tax=Eleginops maclovinus TaxID=56733 RepID=A0AAN8AD67_ELEMC|nr:hypothetical protein PBY51_005620 [Eleginops maclovinus]